MAEDFRADPMESPEGKGIARRSWDAYAKGVNKTLGPALETALNPIVMPYARKQINELIGFYVLWHLFGGFEELVERAGMHPSTVWRKVKKFRVVFKEHPDTYKMPGVNLDQAAFWEDARQRGAERAAAAAKLKD